MLWLVTQFLKVAFLTAKPYEIPGDQSTLKLAVMASFVSHVVAIWGVYSTGVVVGQAVLDLVLSGAALFFGLSAVGKAERFTQSFAALCGANTVINLASMPVIYARLASDSSDRLANQATNEPAAAIDLVGFFFLVWSISVIAHIIRFSFDTNIPVSVIASLGYILVALSVYEFILPF